MQNILIKSILKYLIVPMFSCEWVISPLKSKPILKGIYKKTFSC